MTIDAAKLEEMQKVNLEIDSMIASGDDITAIAYREKNLKSNLFNHRTELLELALASLRMRKLLEEISRGTITDHLRNKINQELGR